MVCFNGQSCFRVYYVIGIANFHCAVNIIHNNLLLSFVEYVRLNVLDCNYR